MSLEARTLEIFCANNNYRHQFKLLYVIEENLAGILRHVDERLHLSLELSFYHPLNYFMDCVSGAFFLCSIVAVNYQNFNNTYTGVFFTVFYFNIYYFVLFVKTLIVQYTRD